MRAVCEIVGLGERKTGQSSKTGKPYDFQTVAFVFDDRFINGKRAATANVSGPELDRVPLNLGDVVEMVLHQDNDRFFVDAILG